MKKLNVCVVGAGGRVGKELLNLILLSEKFIPALGIGRNASGFNENRDYFQDSNNSQVGLVIDFSSPNLMEKSLSFCLDHKIPLVIGTTGMTDNQFELIKKGSEQIPILWSPNMSLGVALFKRCMQAFNSDLEFEYIIEEWHHNKKKDSPSGTAIMIEKHLRSIIKKETQAIVSYRAGGIYGVHKLHAVSDEEHLVLEHTALNRAVFAKGALVGAEWLIKKDKGLFNIDDVLGEKIKS